MLIHKRFDKPKYFLHIFYLYTTLILNSFFSKGGVYMDIAMMSIVNNQNKVKDAASLLLMKKIMNISQTNAANMTEMIKAVDPNLGSNFDKMA
jgi:hypothetical protein